jgi:hypothetical protein
MERCGNRDKVRAYRDRRQHRPDEPSPATEQARPVATPARAQTEVKR